jgi:dolichyl-phosphate beta-glucosyltransferase
MMVSRGDLILYADADGATRFSDIEKVEEGLKKVVDKGMGISCGSRAHLQGEAEAQVSFLNTPFSPPAILPVLVPRSLSLFLIPC